MSLDEALHLHRAAIMQYGGAYGMRDVHALESALAQPRMHVFGEERFPTIAAKAAAYCFFVVRNHSFTDGNKRTGFLVALRFLRKNGVTHGFETEGIVELIEGIAAGSIELEEAIAVFSRALQSN